LGKYNLTSTRAAGVGGQLTAPHITTMTMTTTMNSRFMTTCAMSFAGHEQFATATYSLLSLKAALDPKKYVSGRSEIDEMS
jgi:hypothetical protein